RRHTRFSRDWSSDVCSSDLVAVGFEPTDGGYPSRAFEARSFGRSVTPPLTTLADCMPHPEIAWSQLRGRTSVFPEERFEHGRALGFEHTAAHFRTVCEAPIAHHVPQRPDGARLRFPRPEDHPRHPGEHQRARAHRAGLEG